METTSISLFEGEEIRKTFYEGEWWFVVRDVVEVITSSADVKDYIKKMRKRNPELRNSWNEIVITLPIETNGGVQQLNCSNAAGLIQILRAIPTTKSEPFIHWIATINSPYIAIKNTQSVESHLPFHIE